MDHLDLGSHKGNGSTLSQSIHDRRPSFRLGMGRRRTLSGVVVVTFDMTMTVTVRTQPLLPVKSTFVCCSCSCARPRPQVLLYSFLLVWMTVLFRATRLVVSSLPLPQLRCSPGLVSPLWLPQKKNRRQEEKLILLLRMTYSTENHMGDKETHIQNALLNCPTIPLRDGTRHPAIGFGTYKVGFVPASASSAAAVTASSPPPETSQQRQRTAQECVSDALQVGYRFLECAEFYGNEAHVGAAMVASGIPREKLFLCSKVWTTTIEQGPAAIRAQLDRTLRDLQTNYVDLYLIHWPVPNHHVTAYQTLLELRNEGKIKGVGVSNYAWEDFLELKQQLQLTEADLPLVNQIELNPFLYRSKTVELFQSQGVVLQSYRSLRDGKVFDHPLLLELAQHYHKTTAQILGRWCIQHGFVYVPKSVQRTRMIENADVFDFTLSEEHMQQLNALTTDATKQGFVDLYRKCVNRDTSQAGTLEGVKMDITVD